MDSSLFLRQQGDSISNNDAATARMGLAAYGSQNNCSAWTQTSSLGYFYSAAGMTQASCTVPHALACCE